ncbi:hypothetical protein PCANC_00433 [Puccinia coronata f. sp. avenae]|uniref:Uncharacterized protein n=1 Tax=Puccinia coronata f. sp. avenae TaxID=200324 RepID=A0A2N5W9H0_9BASI|nr:hypothetical protein PCANC_00433 [Puccinia coronata f. sp. avenae]
MRKCLYKRVRPREHFSVARIRSQETCDRSGMPTILDLPQELLELVFSHLVNTPTLIRHPGYRPHSVACIVGSLRLVCRAWADWLYEHHLYHTLSFTSSTQSLAFIDYLGKRSRKLPRAKCQYLRVGSITTGDGPAPLSPTTWISAETLESLIDLFSDTIVTLDLTFVVFFTLPSQTINALGRIKQLHNLWLDFKRGWPRSTDASIAGTQSENSDVSSELALSQESNVSIQGTRSEELDASMEGNRSEDLDAWIEEHPSWLNSLMMEAQGLKLLQLALPLFQMSIPDLMAGARYPAITYLKVDVVRIRPNVLLSIATALKPSLKFLSLANCVEHTVQLLLPVYETLRETLEGFSVSFTQSLTPIRNLSFSKLRVLAVYWLTDFGLLSQPLFSQSPIEILAIAASSTTLDPLTLDTFSKLPQLKKLVFMEARPDYSPPTTWLKVCEARHIKCINVDHSELSLLAVSQIHQLLKFVVHFYL